MTLRHRIYTIAWLVALCPAIAAAQSTGIIAGTARDASGAVIPGVTVEASSPALIEGARSVVTDERGQYRIIDLRPGTYAVTFTLPGFTTVKREGIDLSAGFTAALNAEMRVGSLEETVTVTGASPIVDVQNVNQQRVMDREVIDTIPTGKSYSNLAVLVPGMIVRSSGATSAGFQDVGGQGGATLIRLSIHGGEYTDQQIFIDGYTAGNLSANGDGVMQQFVDGMVEEYTFETSARNAENETSGVRVNVVPKEGGNTYRGSLSGEFTNEDLQSTNLTQDLRDRGLQSVNGVKSVWRVSPAFGGPLKRDRLWFFVSGQRVVNDNYLANLFYNADPTGWRYIPDLNRPMVYDQKNHAYVGRVTWQMTQKDKVAVYGEYNSQCVCHFYSGAFVAPEAANYATFPTKTINGTWTSTFSNKLLTQVGAAYYYVDDYWLAAQGNGRPVIDNGGAYAGLRYGDTAADQRIDSKIINLRGALTYVTGSHNLKVGSDIKLGYADPQINLIPGDTSYTLLNGVPQSVTYSPGPTIRYNRYLPNLGVFVQDQWTLARLTVNAGVRYTQFRTSYPDQTLPTARYRPIARSFEGADVLNWKDINPRVGTAYDVFGNGKTAVKWSLGRYVDQEAVTLTDSVNPISSTSATQNRTWTDNGDFIVQGDPLNLNANGELGRSNNQNFGQSVITTRIDPEYASGFGVRNYNWEFSTGVQHQLIPTVGVSVSYHRRWFGNVQLTDNLAVAPTDYDPFCITAPSDARLPGGGGNRICGLYDIVPAKLGARDNMIRTSESYGTLLQHWNGFDFLVDARLGRALVQGGLSTGKTLVDNCDTVTKIDNPSQAFGSTTVLTNLCRNESPFLNNVKGLASYNLPWDLVVSGAFQSLAGPAMVATYTARNAEIAPSLGRNLAAGPTATVQVQLLDPLADYGERMNQVDFRAAKRFKLGKARLQAQVDLYNMFNGNAVTAHNTNYGTNGQSWLVPQAILAPRLVKFGGQIEF